MTPKEIKELREKHYPSCRQAARAYGVDPSTWSRWEKGTVPIPQHAQNWLNSREHKSPFMEGT